MNIQLVSLFALIIVIIIGARWKVNMGVVAVAFAYILGYFIIGMKPSAIYGNGFPMSTFFRLLGMTFLFGIARINGTLSKVATKVSALAKGNARILPIILFVISFVISAVGPGAIVVVALMMPIAMEVARENDIPDLLMGTVVISGALGGGLSPITATGIVASSFAIEAGVTNYTQIWISSIIAFTLQAVIFYFIFGGLKLSSKRSTAAVEMAATKDYAVDSEGFDDKQKITLIVIGIIVLGIIIPKSAISFMGWDVALAPFVGGTILLLLKAADQEETIASIPWSTLILISGVAILVNVIDEVGGIDTLASYLSGIMRPKTASAIMGMLAGVMSLVSSGTGVVMPTLIPTAPAIAAQMGGAVSTSALASAVIIGCSVVTASPLSSLGALALANATGRTDKDKMFTIMLITGLSGILYGGLLGLLGVYR